jgi:hypothetical protein
VEDVWTNARLNGFENVGFICWPHRRPPRRSTWGSFRRVAGVNQIMPEKPYDARDGILHHAESVDDELDDD